MHQRPFSAIAILDSADGQFGVYPELAEIKRRLLLSTRQYDRALDEALKAADAVPYNPANHVALGEIYEVRGDDSLARLAFERAVQTDSSSVEAWAALGDYYVRKREHEANLDVVQHLFQLDGAAVSEKVSVFENLTSDRRFYRDYYPQLNRLAATLLIKYPDDPQVVALYGGHLIASGEAEQALALYKSHLGDPEPRDYYETVSILEYSLGRPDSALLYIDRAERLWPDDVDIQVRRGTLYQVLGRSDEALSSFRRALKLSQQTQQRSRILGYIGDLYHAQSQRKPSLMKRCYASYERALAADDDNASVLNNYAYFLSLEGRNLERALAMAERATRLEPDNATYIDTHAWVLYRLGRYEEARQKMRTAISLDRTNSPELRLHYGDILAALGENYMAGVYWRRALDFGYEDAQAVEERLARIKSPNDNNTRK